MKLRLSKGGIAFSVLGGITILLFQNCSPVAFKNSEVAFLESPSVTPDSPHPVIVEKKCRFNGAEYLEGQTVTAYLASSVESTESCISEERRCSDGAFSGSYTFASCAVRPAACLFDGTTITSGESVRAFRNSSVAFGQSCVEEDRVCSNGALSGSYNFSSCTVGAAASCIFNGQMVAHGESVTAFPSSIVAYGSTCTGVSRACNNGQLSGSAAFASCSSSTPASCLFNGQTIPHAGTVKAYQTSSVSYGSTCAEQNRVCSNGTLSGSYTFASCTPGAPKSCLLAGQTIAHGQTVVAYQSTSAPFGQTCSSESRTCQDGVLSGSYSSNTCTVASRPEVRCTAVPNLTALPAFTRIGSKCAITSETSFTFNCDADITKKPNGFRIQTVSIYKDGTSLYRGSSYYTQDYYTSSGLYAGSNPMVLPQSAFRVNGPRSLTVSANFLLRNHGADEPYHAVYGCSYVQRYDLNINFYVGEPNGSNPTLFIEGAWPALSLPAR